MRWKSTLLAGLTAFLLTAAAAEGQKKVEIFGGYQYAYPDGGPNLNGWNGALTGNLTKSFGVTADFSGAYASGGSVYTYAVGPKLTGTLGVAKPFVHALFGGVRLGGNGGSTTGFGMAVGGGVDVGRGTLAWRALQADWLVVRFAGVTDRKNVRVSTGLVVRF